MYRRRVQPRQAEWHDEGAAAWGAGSQRPNLAVGRWRACLRRGAFKAAGILAHTCLPFSSNAEARVVRAVGVLHRQPVTVPSTGHVDLDDTRAPLKHETNQRGGQTAAGLPLAAGSGSAGVYTHVLHVLPSWCLRSKSGQGRGAHWRGRARRKRRRQYAGRIGNGMSLSAHDRPATWQRRPIPSACPPHFFPRDLASPSPHTTPARRRTTSGAPTAQTGATRASRQPGQRASPRYGLQNLLLVLVYISKPKQLEPRVDRLTVLHDRQLRLGLAAGPGPIFGRPSAFRTPHMPLAPPCCAHIQFHPPSPVQVQNISAYCPESQHSAKHQKIDLLKQCEIFQADGSFFLPFPSNPARDRREQRV